MWGPNHQLTDAGKQERQAVDEEQHRRSDEHVQDSADALRRQHRNLPRGLTERVGSLDAIARHEIRHERVDRGIEKRIGDADKERDRKQQRRPHRVGPNQESQREPEGGPSLQSNPGAGHAGRNAEHGDGDPPERGGFQSTQNEHQAYLPMLFRPCVKIRGRPTPNGL